MKRIRQRAAAKVSDIIELFPNMMRTNTGGGCRAWAHRIGEEKWILITDMSGLDLPKDTDRYVLAGQYADDGWQEYRQGGARIPVKRLENWLDKRIMERSKLSRKAAHRKRARD